MAYDLKKLKSLPEKSGVYVMRGSRQEVLYVGKAKNIKQRVKQYFVASSDQRPTIPHLIAKVHTIETVVVSSEKEALLLENNLIKQFKPKYNVLLKDDKSYLALKISKEKWPRIDLVRYKGKPKENGTYFGPYTSAFAARNTLDLVRDLFPLRVCSNQEFAKRKRPCILYDMGRCLAPCVGNCSEVEYDRQVADLTRFLRGSDKLVLKHLHDQIQKHSKKLEFEKAAALHKKIQQIEKTIEAQYVDQPMGKSFDVLGLYREGDGVCISLMIYRFGKLLGARNFCFSHVVQTDEELLQTFIMQHYSGFSEKPQEVLASIVLDSIIADLIAGDENKKVQILSPKRGAKFAQVKMAQENAKVYFRQKTDEKAMQEQYLLQMQEKFRLKNYPEKIECFDVSTLSGQETVATAVAFLNAEKNKNQFRKYKIKETSGPDDYAAMYEALSRRFKRGKEEQNLPDLLIVDGGKGHLNVAMRVFKEQEIISVDLIALVKEEARHDKGLSLERVFLPNIKDSIILKRHSGILFLLQRIRDEAHRFSIEFQKNRRSKAFVKSVLDDIPGIGPKKRNILLKAFGSVKKIREQTQEAIASIKGITQKDAQRVASFLSQKIKNF